MEDYKEQVLPVSGALDMDHDLKDIKEGDYVDAVNFRNVYTENGIDGKGENISSNVLVAFTLPGGTNKCIGKHEDRQNNCLYYFVWNSGAAHSILRYKPQQSTTGLIEQVAQGAVLNFNQDIYINGVNVLGDLLYCNNPFYRQCKINIKKAINTNKSVHFKLCASAPKASFTTTYTFQKGATTVTVPFTYTYGTGTVGEVITQLRAQLAASGTFAANFTATNISDNYVEVVALSTGIWTVDVGTPSITTEALWY